MRNLDIVAAILVIIGAISWGLVGTANFDLVATLFGAGSILSRLIYTVVGVAGLYQIVEFRAIQRRWTGPSVPAHPA